MIEKILEYQQTEKSLLDLEREVHESSDRKKALELKDVMQAEYSKLVALEKSAARVSAAYNKASQKYSEYMKKLEELEKELESADESKVAVYEKAYKDFFAVANSLEKEITAMYTEVQRVSREYEELIKKSKAYKEQYEKYKNAFAKLKADKEPKIEELKTKLQSMKKNIDEKLYQMYTQKRESKKFPVFVALAGKKCGGCQMEVSTSKLSAMNTNSYGLIECENCGRYIYKK